MRLLATSSERGLDSCCRPDGSVGRWQEDRGYRSGRESVGSRLHRHPPTTPPPCALSRACSLAVLFGCLVLCQEPSGLVFAAGHLSRLPLCRLAAPQRQWAATLLPAL